MGGIYTSLMPKRLQGGENEWPSFNSLRSAFYDTKCNSTQTTLRLSCNFFPVVFTYGSDYEWSGLQASGAKADGKVSIGRFASNLRINQG